MPDKSDTELLRDYSRQGSETAFAELVRRHINLVHSAALRHVGTPAHAEEITQAVFVILARKAARLRPDTILDAWLYETTRLTSLSFLRGERRRHFREQEAYMQSTLRESGDAPLWNQLAPHLDEAMARLDKKDREAVVLRFFKEKSLNEVAAALQITEAAAQSRVHRAVDKLRGHLTKRGIVVSAAALTAAISAHSVQAAPAVLATSVTTLAFAKGASAGGSTLTLIKGALKIMAWTKAKMAIVSGVVVLLTAGTATVTITVIAHHQEESVWSHITGVDLTQMENAPPTVSIRPTRFTRELAGPTSRNGKILALYQPFDSLLAWAYNTSPCRIMALTPLPQGDFDFIANVPQRQREALQEMIEKKFGIIGRRETRECNVLLLTVKRRDAPGLHPTSSQDKTPRLNAFANHWQSSNRPIDSLLSDLEYYLQVPVVDRTGLTGRFDVDLTWEDEMKWDGSTGRFYFSNPNGLKQAVLDQLGLELVPSSEPTEMLVVERVNH